MTNTYTTLNSIVPNGTTVGGTITLSGTGSSGSSYTIGTGISNQYITTTGSSTGYTWATPNTNFNDGNTPVMTIPHGSKTVEIDKAATLDIKGNVKINGIDLEERLRTIEKVLMIPERDVKLEKKYPKLKKMYDEYIAALGKYKTFEAIKGEDE